MLEEFWSFKDLLIQWNIFCPRGQFNEGVFSRGFSQTAEQNAFLLKILSVLTKFYDLKSLLGVSERQGAWVSAPAVRTAGDLGHCTEDSLIQPGGKVWKSSCKVLARSFCSAFRLLGPHNWRCEWLAQTTEVVKRIQINKNMRLWPRVVRPCAWSQD